MVTTYDPSATGLPTPANANAGLGDATDLTVSTETDDAALADGYDAEEAATESADVPFDFDALDDTQRQYLDQYYQEQYQQKYLAELSNRMSSRDRENNTLRGQLNAERAQRAAAEAAPDTRVAAGRSSAGTPSGRTSSSAWQYRA